MTTYHLRITSQEQKYVDFIKRQTKNAVIVFEDADEEVNRDHMHAIIELNVKLQTFRNNFLKAFPEIKGNGNYTLRQNDDTEANYRYVCKGKSENDLPNVVVNLKDISVVDFHKKYWENNKKGKKQKRDTTKTFVRQCADECMEIRNDWKNDLLCRKIVLGIVMRNLGEKGKAFDSIVVRRLVNGVMNILDPQGMTAYMEYLIFDQKDLEYLR